MNLKEALDRPEVAPVVDWYKSVNPADCLAALSQQDQVELEHDEDAAVGYTLVNKLIDALPDEDMLAERLTDYIIYNVV